MLCATHKNFHRIELNRWCDRVLNIYNFTQSESISTYHQKNLRKVCSKGEFKNVLVLNTKKESYVRFSALGIIFIPRRVVPYAKESRSLGITFSRNP